MKYNESREKEEEEKSEKKRYVSLTTISEMFFTLSLYVRERERDSRVFEN